MHEPQIPFYFRWLYHVSFFQYALGVLQINQFKDFTFSDCPPNIPLTCVPSCATCLSCSNLTNLNNCFETGLDYLSQNHIHPDDLPFNFGILAVVAAVMGIMGYYVTRRVVRTH